MPLSTPPRGFARRVSPCGFKAGFLSQRVPFEPCPSSLSADQVAWSLAARPAAPALRPFTRWTASNFAQTDRTLDSVVIRPLWGSPRAVATAL